MSAQGATLNPVDLEAALDGASWSWFQRFILLLAALAFTVDGLANQVLGVAIPSIVHEWHTPRAAFAGVAALGLLGVGLGAAIGGVIGDRFGRRVGLTTSMLLFGGMTMLAATTHDVHALGLVRLLDGLGIGAAIPNGAAITAEFTPMRRRSLALSFTMLFIPVGGIVSGVFGAALLPGMGWRGLFLTTGGVTLAIAVLFLLLLPESPRFLVGRPRRRLELLKLMARCGYGFSSDATFVEGRVVERKAPMSALFGPDIRLDTAALWGGFFLCLMASYSFFSWLPTLLAGQGLGPRATSLDMTAFNTGGMIGGIMVGWLIHQFGSRLSVSGVAIAGAVVVVAMSMTRFTHGAMETTALVLAVGGAMVGGLHTGLYLIAATAYPAYVRATGVGAAAAFGRVGAILSAYTGVWTLDHGGPRVFFLVIAGALAASALAVVVIRRQASRSVGADASIRQEVHA